jgi:hypothetical protein
MEESPESLGQFVYNSEPDFYGTEKIVAAIMHMPGFADYNCKYPQVLRDALAHKDVNRRVFALNAIRDPQKPIPPIVRWQGFHSISMNCRSTQ